MNKCSMIYSKYKIISIVFIMILVFSLNSSNVLVNADDLIGTTTSYTSGTGNYAIVLPDTTTGETYNVTLGIISQYDDGTYVYASDEVYYVRVVNPDGTTNEDLSSYYKFVATYNNIHSLQERVVTVQGVPEGSTVYVENVIVEKDEYDAQGNALWSNYYITYMATTIANPNGSDIILIDSDSDLIELVVGETVTQTTISTGQDANYFIRDTDDTLLSVHEELFGSYFEDGYYDEDFITYLLSTYNVVSLDEINSTHIIGPIIAQNTAERTAENGEISGVLVAGDYSNGVPSYVGDFSVYGASGSQSVSLKFNYTFDFTQFPNFSAPYLYSDEKDLEISLVGETSNLQDFYVLDDGTVLSSNHSGLTETYQNDNFIDFTALEQALIQASYSILEDGNAEGYDEFIRYEFNDVDGTAENAIIHVYEGGVLVKTITSTNGETYGEDENERGFSDFVTVADYHNNDGSGIRLTINIEESWTILNAINLQEVNMILPDDYDYYDNPYLSATTINFDCEYINKTYYEFEADLDGDGVDEVVSSYHSLMPYTLINGVEFTATLGEDGEYSEVGNKIIWNMPYVVTDSETGDNRLSVMYTSHNIAGHIIAPQAEFWNYDENGNWLGGNLNGGAIVKSFYSGIMEMHMWAYSGLAEEAIVFGIEAVKTVNGELPTSEYTFIVDVVYDSDGSIPDGIMNTTFPMYANSNTDTGAVKFSSVAFNEAGTYSFILYEDTSMDTVTDNITYDLTQYRIDIIVGVSEESDAETTIYEIVNTEKYMIVDSYGNTLATPELLEENPDVIEFDFDNIATTEGTVNLYFIKQCTTGHVLSGAKFYVTEMTSATNESRPSGGYFESITSDASGYVYIENLEKNTYYKLWEYEAPYGHTVAEGYWIIYIDEYGFVASITAKNGAQEIGSEMIIYNEHEESTYLDLTLTKKNQMNSTLSDVDFTLQRVVIDAYGVPQVVANGYYEEYTTDEYGTFEIVHLEADYIYMLTETSTPVAHIEHTGYWLITVTGDTLNPSADLTYTIIEYDENNNAVSQSSNNVIMNEKEEFVLPTTGGIGKEAVYILGITLMLTSFGLYKRVNIKDTNKKI